jgi:hypothetical protein
MVITRNSKHSRSIVILFSANTIIKLAQPAYDDNIYSVVVYSFLNRLGNRRVARCTHAYNKQRAMLSDEYIGLCSHCYFHTLCVHIYQASDLI